MRFLARWGRWLALASVSVLSLPLLADERELPRWLALALVAGAGLLARLRGAALFVSRGWVRAALLGGVVLVAEAGIAESPGRFVYGSYEGHQGALAVATALLVIASSPGSLALRDACTALFVLAGSEAALAMGQFAEGLPPTGTLGHPMFLAMLLTLGALAGLGLSLEARGPARRTGLALGVTLIVFAEVVAARRMPLAALLFGAGLVVSRSEERRRVRAVLGLAPVALVLGAWLHRPDSMESLVNRVASVFEPAAAAGGEGERLDYYRVAWNAWQEHPWLGWGFGAFRDLYAQRKMQGIARFEARVHDLPLELLLSIGLVGVAAMAPLLLLTARLWIRAWRAAKEGTQLAALAAGPAYLLCLLVNFNQPGVEAWALTLGAFPLLEAPWSPRLRLGGAAIAGLLIMVWCPAAAADLLARWGNEREQAGDRSGGLESLRGAVRLAPHEDLYRLRQAVTESSLARWESAPGRAALLEAGLRGSPRSSFLHEHLAIALADEGRPAEALTERHRAVELAPGYAPFRDSLARAEVAAGQLALALGDLTAAVTLEPWGPAWRNNRAQVLRQLGRRPEARADYLAAIDDDPRNEEYRRNLRSLEASGP